MHYSATTQTKPLIEKIMQWIINKEQGMVISFVNELMILKNTNFNKIWTQLEDVNFIGNLTQCKLWSYILFIFPWLL